MKTIVQLLIVALILHGCVRFGAATWRYYQFKDAVEQEARFGAKLTTAELHARVLALAEEHGVALEFSDVVVERRREETSVSAVYVDEIPLVPGVYTREHVFDVEVSVRVVRPLTVDDIR